MPPRSLLRTIVLAGLVSTALYVPQSARAQGLIDFLWGGGEEWGGSRQVVSFSQQYSPNQIIVSFGDRRLYYLTKRGEAISYPIAVPREQSRWQGTTAVSSKRENPSWRPTPDMIKENPKLPTWVPGGHPMNPLGVRAMYLGASTYRIHGTDAPWTIGKAVSKGCIRMTNEDVLDLYPRVPVGMKVTVTWQRFSTDGSVSAQDNGEPSVNTASQNVSEEPSAEIAAQHDPQPRAAAAPSERRRRNHRLERPCAGRFPGNRRERKSGPHQEAGESQGKGDGHRFRQGRGTEIREEERGGQGLGRRENCGSKAGRGERTQA